VLLLRDFALSRPGVSLNIEVKSPNVPVKLSYNERDGARRVLAFGDCLFFRPRDRSLVAIEDALLRAPLLCLGRDERTEILPQPATADDLRSNLSLLLGVRPDGVPLRDDRRWRGDSTGVTGLPPLKGGDSPSFAGGDTIASLFSDRVHSHSGSRSVCSTGSR